ncbi:MAG TPA: AMP-binding protein [Acidobacteriaceae bacterium]
MRPHLASLVTDFHTHAKETAVVSHRGVRRYATTYGELAQLAGRFAAELIARDIHAGDRVLLWGENSADWIGAFFGCLLRGVLAVPLDASGTPAFAQRVIEEVRPRLVLADAGLLQSLPQEIPALKFSELAASLPATPNFAVEASVREDTPFQIVFTSGTTSEPKGIVHTHRNVLASLHPIENEIGRYRRYERWVHPLRFLHTLPLSHVFGQFMGLWIPAVLGAELHFTDTLEAGSITQLIRRERISVLVAVPRIVSLLRTYLLARFPKLAAEIEHAAGLSILKRWWRFRAVHRVFGWKFWAVISGGAALPAELELFWNRVGLALVQGYGLTETAALVTLNHPFRIARGTIGKALPGREVRINEAGELLVRGDMVARSTWQGGQLRQREDEWLATGDLAEQNEAGEFRFLGRKGEAIVTSSGLNIFPSDLEAALVRQPAVRACVVIPCDFPTGPEAVAVVVFQGDEAALQRSVQEANRTLAEYQHIRRVLRWPELDFPYTSSGKLLRRTIHEWACKVSQNAGTKTTPENTTIDPLLAIIATITGEPAPSPDDTLRLSEDLHLDSLGRVQLASALEEKTGALLPDSDLAAAQTLGDLRRLTGYAPSTAAPAWLAQDISHTTKPAEAAAPAAPIANTSTKTGPRHRYPLWPLSTPVKILRAIFLEAIAQPLIGVLLAPPVIRAQSSLPDGPMLIIANHITQLDGPLVLYALPSRWRRRIAVAMSGEMLMDFRTGKRGSVFGPAAYWLLTALYNVFPLPRLQGFRQSFAHAGQAMDRGYSVLIFPEGTRSQSGEMASFRQGIGLLAIQAQVPVLPVFIRGMHEIRTRRVRWLRSGKLSVRVGELIPANVERSAEEWTALLESVMREMSVTSVSL